MFLKTYLFLFFCCISLTGFAGHDVYDDIIVLKNGDHLKGEIKQLKYGILTYKTADIQTLTIRWAYITKVKSTGPFELTLKDQTIGLYTLDSTANDMEAILVNGDNRILKSLDDIVELILISKKFKSRLDGSVNLGLSYTKSSDYFQFSISENVTYNTFHNQLKLNTTANITKQNTDSLGSNVTSLIDIMIPYQRFFNKNWYVLALTGFQQNTELGVKARIMLGAGGGKDLFATNLHTLSLSLAPLYTREWSSEAPVNSAEIGIITGYQIYKYLIPRVILQTSVATFINLTDLGRVRLQATQSLDLEVVSDFKISLSSNIAYDNRPVDTTADKFDWTFSATIGYSF